MKTDWVAEAKRTFAVAKPEHFTYYNHCDECFEHDETLRSNTVEEIGLNQLGNPGWDPLCCCSADGMKYYLPALIRLSLETISKECYFEQFLFHLTYGGNANDFFKSCSATQRNFVARFLGHIISLYPAELEQNLLVDDALNAYTLWSARR